MKLKKANHSKDPSNKNNSAHNPKLRSASKRMIDPKCINMRKCKYCAE